MFCYADDLILTSLTTGLQSLMNISRNYITSLCLNFNPSKTTCTTFGTTHQVVNPTWSLNGVKLKQDESVTYLGTRLSNQTRDNIDSSTPHILWSPGRWIMCERCQSLYNCTHVTAIQPILAYGCSTIKLKPNDIDELEKVQASLIKAALGLSKYSRNTPILRALNIKKIGRILDERHLSLTRAALHNTSKSRTFYLHIMHKCQYQHMNKHCNLLQRSKLICNSKGIMLLKYLLDESYALKCKLLFKDDSSDALLIQ